MKVGLRADALDHKVVGQPGVVLRVVLDVGFDLRHLRCRHYGHGDFVILVITAMMVILAISISINTVMPC